MGAWNLTSFPALKEVSSVWSFVPAHQQDRVRDRGDHAIEPAAVVFRHGHPIDRSPELLRRSLGACRAPVSLGRQLAIVDHD